MLTALVGVVMFAYQVLLWITLTTAHHLYHHFFEKLLPTAVLSSTLFLVMLVVFVWLFHKRESIYRRLSRVANDMQAWDTTSINVPATQFFRSMGDEVALRD